LERRPVKGSDFYEYRAEALTKVAVEALCENVFDSRRTARLAC
jgi:hypothetical protein